MNNERHASRTKNRQNTWLSYASVCPSYASVCPSTPEFDEIFAAGGAVAVNMYV